MSLITDISQVRAASSINVSNTLSSWQPYLDEAEISFISPVIGAALFALLKEKAQSETVAPFTEAIRLVRIPLALYALCLGIDEFSVSVSGQGIQVIETDTHKSAPQYKVQNLKETWMRRAHTLLDVALDHLETHKADFPLFSPQDPDLFIHCAADFNRLVDIRSSSRVFLALKPIISSIEKKYIKPTVSPAYFAALKTAVGGQTDLAAADQTVMDLIQPALAHLTIARALQDISIDILDWGIFSTAASTFTNLSTKQTSNQVRISAMIEANQKDGEAELKELQQYLDIHASADVYPLYFASERYAGPTVAKNRTQFPNSATNSFFVA